MREKFVEFCGSSAEYHGSSVRVTLTTLSFPHLLHLIGRSLISVVGSNHKTVCLPHTGHIKRLRFVFVSSDCGFSNSSCKSHHLVFHPLATKNKKACTIIAYTIKWHRLSGSGTEITLEFHAYDRITRYVFQHVYYIQYFPLCQFSKHRKYEQMHAFFVQFDKT